MSILIEKDNLTIHHQKNKPDVFYIALVCFLFLYFYYIKFLPNEGYWIFNSLCLWFLSYLFLLTCWVDHAEISKSLNTIVVVHGIWPFRKTNEQQLSRFSLVYILRRTRMNRGYTEIGLMENETSNFFCLLTGFHTEKTWKYAVALARFLNFPLYDLMIDDHIKWSPNELPETIKERRKRLNDKIR